MDIIITPGSDSGIVSLKIVIQLKVRPQIMLETLRLIDAMILLLALVLESGDRIG